MSAARLQRQLGRLRDLSVLRRLEDDLRAEGRWQQAERLKELRRPGVSHQWLWHLDPATGPVMDAVDY
eukprot:232734-Lingulodinium_polyedra.AAC.1